MSNYYVTIDERGNILSVFLGEVEHMGPDAICVREGGWQNFGLDDIVETSLFNNYGFPLYRLLDGQITLRDQIELEAESPGVVLMPSIEERTSALESALLELILGGDA